MNSYPVIILTLIIAAIPVTAIISLAYALYDWLISRLPKNVQTMMIAHESQIRRVITTVVDAIEQSMPGETGISKKAQAVAMATDIFDNLPLPKSIPKPSPALIDALIEQSVAYLPPPKKPLYAESKPTSDSNVFVDTTPTTPLPTFSAVGAVPSPLDPPPFISDAL